MKENLGHRMKKKVPKFLRDREEPREKKKTIEEDRSAIGKTQTSTELTAGDR